MAYGAAVAPKVASSHQAIAPVASFPAGSIGGPAPQEKSE